MLILSNIKARGDLANIKPGELAWSFVSSVTGKKIIADCGEWINPSIISWPIFLKIYIPSEGYGVAGGESNNCGSWSNPSLQNARINDGVISLSVAKPDGRVARPGVTC